MVYQVLDQVLADRTVAAKSRGAMFSVIDELRQGTAPAEDLRRAERISIAMHRLEWALQQGDRVARETALADLRALAAGWLDSRICN
jgi:hypothetical protein